MTGNGDLFGLNADPDVVAARRDWARRQAAYQSARPGNKLVLLGKLQAATETVLKVEKEAEDRLRKEKRYEHRSR